METLEIVPVVKKAVFEIFDLEDEAKLLMDAGSISISSSLRMHDGCPVRIRVDAGDEETFIKVVTANHGYETRVFTDTLTPELIERYLRKGNEELTYELDFEERLAARRL